MIHSENRHYTEEELLLHLLEEEDPEMGQQIRAHAERCGECGAVLADYRVFISDLAQWDLPPVSEAEWQELGAQLMERYRREPLARIGMWFRLHQLLHFAWSYAVENPLPTLGYVAVALAFALERTIHTLRLDRILPATGELFEILRQML